MLPVNQTNVWTLATDEDKETAHALLSSLPRTSTIDPAIEDASYGIALEGVTRWGLETAVRQILQGSLGRAFYPSPAELRQTINRAMEPHVENRQRELHRQRLADEREPIREIVRTPEELERHRKLMAGFHASYEAVKGEDLEAERAEIRARYGMTDELLAQIKDAPKVGKRVDER